MSDLDERIKEVQESSKKAIYDLKPLYQKTVDEVHDLMSHAFRSGFDEGIKVGLAHRKGEVR